MRSLSWLKAKKAQAARICSGKINLNARDEFKCPYVRSITPKNTPPATNEPGGNTQHQRRQTESSTAPTELSGRDEIASTQVTKEPRTNSQSSLVSLSQD
jgi:hypothetical protein